MRRNDNNYDPYISLYHTIETMLNQSKRVLCAIDGPCASGKSTLAAFLARQYNGNLVPMDDFFLPPAKRTPKRLMIPGGNIDYERVEDEVLIPLTKAEAFSYQPYDCTTEHLKNKISIPPRMVNIVEGSYSLHPGLQKYYNIKVFLTIDKKQQLHRLQQRNPRLYDRFIHEWIPLEQKYFEAYQVKNNCDFIF